MIQFSDETRQALERIGWAAAIVKRDLTGSGLAEQAQRIAATARRVSK